VSVYCTAPWNGITVQVNGSVTTCCVGKVSLGNINQQSIIEIINNPTHQQIKQNLLDNTNLKENCQVCLDLEKNSGSTPVRQQYLNDFPTLSNKLRFLDIRWTNFCNLTCVYCNSYNSSAWADKLDSNNKKINKYDSDDNSEDFITINKISPINTNENSIDMSDCSKKLYFSDVDYDTDINNSIESDITDVSLGSNILHSSNISKI
jgi:radical SAM protein with 4Fe4S-binding SPASM domain